MSTEYTISLSQIEKEFSLERVTVPENYDLIQVTTPEVWRPGLALTGFYDIFDNDRISVIGNAEHCYLSGLDANDRKKKLVEFIEHLPTAVIFSRNLEVFPELREKAEEIGVPVFTTKEKTSPLIAALITIKRTSKIYIPGTPLTLESTFISISTICITDAMKALTTIKSELTFRTTSKVIAIGNFTEEVRTN